jgi:hypothetical protein
MHINSTGEGSPTVILDSGLSDSSLSWVNGSVGTPAKPT